MKIGEKYTWLITGGAGFIGSNIARILLAKGQKVIIYDNFSTGLMSNVRPSVLGGRVKIIKGDIRNFNTLTKAFKGADFVLHHAALASVPQSLKEPQKTLDINVLGTLNALEAARQNKIRKFIFASSSTVYGNGGAKPCGENAPTACKSPYALSKLQGEELCRVYTRLYGLATVCLRYFNVFGPGQNANGLYAAVIAKFTDCALKKKPFVIYGDGKQTRDFIFTDDVAKANILAVLKGKQGQIYNVAAGRSYTLLEIIKTIEKICKTKPAKKFLAPRAVEIKKSSADISKIKKIGFAPSVSLEDGLKTIIRP